MTASFLSTFTAILGVVAAAIVARAIWFGGRALFQRRTAARAPSEQQRVWHGEFMRELVGLVGRDTSPSRRLSTLQRRLGWTEGQALLVLDYLSGKGLVKKAAWMAAEQEPFKTIGEVVGGVRVKLTEGGLDEAERAEHGPTRYLPHLPHIVTGDHSPVTLNSPWATIQSPGSTQTLIQHGLDPTQVVAWMQMYRDALDLPSSLSEATIRHTRSLLDDLDDALAKRDPSRVDRLGRTLRAIAEGVAGNAAFAAILAAAKAFPFGS
jgi:hypothetical protein